mmetsp:Transcript_15530/g.24172  ORF Transcript_15530/g.24172 Transcript_15530/m.24172 type:complete len:80 (+) Transcript_15530:726-965(+)
MALLRTLSQMNLGVQLAFLGAAMGKRGNAYYHEFFFLAFPFSLMNFRRCTILTRCTILQLLIIFSSISVVGVKAAGEHI